MIKEVIAIAVLVPTDYTTIIHTKRYANQFLKIAMFKAAIKLNFSVITIKVEVDV